ncbi:hypothetical protein Tcan_12108 [Toxocara canis]|uniref:Uncharacterized protein n=1 Tax=Toxocara canis TaxID=6265 RepID=A0A0B2UNE9_TOXCA|nr:hypothetical protein Tcan_12108 [Toxocara canis]
MGIFSQLRRAFRRAFANDYSTEPKRIWPRPKNQTSSRVVPAQRTVPVAVVKPSPQSHSESSSHFDSRTTARCASLLSKLTQPPHYLGPIPLENFLRSPRVFKQRSYRRTLLLCSPLDYAAKTTLSLIPKIQISKTDEASAKTARSARNKKGDSLELDVTERSQSKSRKSRQSKRKHVVLSFKGSTSSSTDELSQSSSVKKSKGGEKRTSADKGKQEAAVSGKDEQKEVEEPCLTKSLVEKLLPIALKEGEEGTKVTAVYDPWMSLDELSERSGWLYSPEVARLNTIMSISYFINQRRSSKEGASKACPRETASSLSIENRAQRTTFSVKDREKQSNDSFNINDYPQKNAIPSRR